MHEDLTLGGAQVVGVSPQSAQSHQAFAARYQLPFPLLVDEKKVVARAYDALLPFGIGFRRVTYLINQQQTISQALEANLNVGEHLDWLRSFASSAKLTE